jgi:hypothetical protein
VVETRLAAMQQAMGAAGGDGRAIALHAIDAVVSRQAAVLAFEKVFFLAGILFLFVTPLLAFLKAPSDVGGAPKHDAHIDL